MGRKGRITMFEQRNVVWEDDYFFFFFSFRKLLHIKLVAVFNKRW